MGSKFLLLACLGLGAVLFGAVCAADGVDAPIEVLSEADSPFLFIQGEFTLGGQTYTFEGSAVERGPVWQSKKTVENEHWYFTADKTEGYTDYQRVPALLGVNGKLYQVKLDYKARRIQVTPYTGETARIDIGLETERLSLKAEDGSPAVMLYRPGKQAAIPPGKYKLDQYQLVTKDEKGARWYVCALATDKCPTLTLTAGAGSTLSIGGPYVPGVQASVVKLDPGLIGRLLGRREKEVALLKLALSGTWNENAAQVYPVATMSRPPAPKYTIRKPDGEIVAQGRFEYG